MALEESAQEQGLRELPLITYYNDAATGKANDKLVNVTGPSGDIKAYLYDNLQRLTTENYTISGVLFSKTF